MYIARTSGDRVGSRTLFVAGNCPFGRGSWRTAGAVAQLLGGEDDGRGDRPTQDFCRDPKIVRDGWRRALLSLR